MKPQKAINVVYHPVPLKWDKVNTRMSFITAKHPCTSKQHTMVFIENAHITKQDPNPIISIKLSFSEN